MKTKLKKLKPKDICSNPDGQLTVLDAKDFMPLPPPYDTPDADPMFKKLTDEQLNKYEASLDGVLAVAIPKPETKEEEDRLVRSFLEGLKKLLTPENNWTFLQPLMLTLEYCAKCNTCNEACPVYISSGKNDIYRPNFRSEILRKIYKKYIKPGGKALAYLQGDDIDLNWKTVARLAELSYRCTICRRCAQTCPIGVDNALITHELRKLFSQELGIAAIELHKSGTVKHLRDGSSTGMVPVAFQDTIEFMEDEIKEKTGLDIKFPIDKEGADILLIHNAGEYLSWPENPMAFAIIFEAAGLNWTLSSEKVGYDGVNYGLWYDDVQFSRVAVKHASIAKKLGVKKIVVGECGHAHKAISVIADRVLTGELNVPRESCFTLLEDIVMNNKIKVDPEKNADIPVTLHDPCNTTRLMGIIKPQRNVMKKICPKFREMVPNGPYNYCCGGGSGFAVMPSMNFPNWRAAISCRMKFKQILEAFQDCIDPSIKKMVCAPCSNCKGGMRDVMEYFDSWHKAGIWYTGLVEFIVNAMVDIKEPYIEWPMM